MINMLVRLCSHYYYNNAAHGLLRLEQRLRDRGVGLQDCPSGTDLIWAQEGWNLDDYCRLHKGLDVRYPVIVQDCYIGPELNDNLRLCLQKHPNIYRVLKPAAFTQSRYYHENWWPGKYQHSSMLHHPENTPIEAHPIALYSDHIAKIVPSLGLTTWPSTFGVIANALRLTNEDLINLDTDRDVPISCCISTPTPANYQQSIIDHRLEAYKVTRSIPGSYVGFDLPGGSFWYSLTSSKCVVSPYGYVPLCWRDYEAALAGAVVIKPYSPTINWPSVEFVYCKPDFSDLLQIVNDVNQNWESYRELRRRNRERLIRMMNDDYIADYIVALVKETLDAFHH